MASLFLMRKAGLFGGDGGASASPHPSVGEEIGGRRAQGRAGRPATILGDAMARRTGG